MTIHQPATKPNQESESILHKYVFLGPPGVGKGTQAQLLSVELGIPTISTGDIIRAEIRSDSPRASALRKTVERGDLLSDDLVIELIEERLAHTSRGYILDGFPRTREQAEALHVYAPDIRAALLFEADFQTISARIANRSGGRQDDTEDVARHRFQIYRSHLRGLVEFYQSRSLLRRIAAEADVHAVTTQMRNAAGL